MAARQDRSTFGETARAASFTHEALLQLNKERGKDLGDDPTADGTGAELGIKDRRRSSASESEEWSMEMVVLGSE